MELNRYVYAMGNPVTWSDPSGYTTGYSILTSRNASRTAPAVGLLGYKTAYSFGSVVFNILFASANWPYLEDIIDDLVLDPIWVDFIENLDFDGLPDPDPDTNPSPKPQCCAEPINPNPENDEDGWVFVGYHGTSEWGFGRILDPTGPGIIALDYINRLQLGPGFYVDQDATNAEFWADQKEGDYILSIWMRESDYKNLNICQRSRVGHPSWWPGVGESARYKMSNSRGLCDVEVAPYDTHPPNSSNAPTAVIPPNPHANQWKFNSQVLHQLVPVDAR